MPRRSRPRAPAAAHCTDSTDKAGPQTSDVIESGADGDWIVRSLAGSGSTRAYRCPGCDHEIRPATPHLVVWPVDDPDGVDRRHWHRTCWRSRGRRNPGRSHW